MKPLNCLFTCLLLIITSLVSMEPRAHADAVLSQGSEYLFPDEVRLDVEVAAQVEVSTYLLHFTGADEIGDYVLTVPSPKGSYVIGVDIDRGDGFVPTAMVGEAPPPAFGGTPVAQDPAVAQWLGTSPLRADFAELAPGAFTVRVRFQRLLRRYQGVVKFETGTHRSPLRPASDPGARASGVLRLRSSRPLRELEFAGDGASEQQDELGTTIEWGDDEGDATLSVHYQEELAEIDMHFLTHRAPGSDPQGGDEGYFMLIIDADDASPGDAQPRSLSLVIDKSGSMQGAKIDQAREAARAMLDHLGPQDSFNIISFDEVITQFRSNPVPATITAIEAARGFIKGIDDGGGTDLDLGIQTGLEGIDASEADTFDAMIFLSDGRATSGETDSVQIHDNALQRNPAKARIFSFSVGAGADRNLLEALARSNRGRHFQLNDAQATQEMLEQVNRLFEDIRVVKLTDLDVKMQGMETHQVLPEEMQDLFSGGQAVLVGRYTPSNSASINLSGKNQGAGFLQSSSITANALQEDNAFIKHLWATEKVSSLLAKMSTGGDTTALREEIVALGLAYRIQTPYTSFSTAGLGGGGAGGTGSAGGASTGCSLTKRSSLPEFPIALGLLLLAGLLRRRTGLSTL